MNKSAEIALSAAGSGPRPAPLRRALLAWLPTLVWLVVLALFSTDTFSAEHTGGILLKIIHAFYGGISQQRMEEMNFLVRKSAHFSGYGLLSALAFFSWRATFPSVRPWSFRWVALALALTLAAASLDEFHQSFVPSRTSSPWDVVLDMVGALGFQFAIALWIRLRKPQALEANSFFR